MRDFLFFAIGSFFLILDVLLVLFTVALFVGALKL